MTWYLTHLESWDNPATADTQNISRRYLNNDLTNINMESSDVVDGLRCLKVGQSVSIPRVFALNFGGNCKSVHCGFWMKINRPATGESSRTATDSMFTTFSPDALSDHLQMSRHITGYLTFFRASTLLGTGNRRVSNNAWHYYEMFFRMDDGSSPAGKWIVDVDGINVFDYTGITYWVTNRYISSIAFQGRANTQASNEVLVDGFWCRVSPDLENSPTFYGPSIVRYLAPNGDGNYSQWTSTASPTHYTEIDETGDDDANTTYISTAANGNKATFTYPNLSLATGETIKGVGVRDMVAKVTAATGGAHKNIARISSTDYYGIEKYHAQSFYRVEQTCWENSPATASAWTEAEVNGAEFGIEYVG